MSTDYSKKPNLDMHAKNLFSIILQASAYECFNISDLWKINFNNEEKMLFFLEYNFILIALADRVLFEKYGDPYREKVLNNTINLIKIAFRQSKLGEEITDKDLFFENKFNDVFSHYSKCSSILGENKNQLVSTATIRLIDVFLSNKNIDVNEELFTETGSSLSTSILAILDTKAFKINFE